MSVGALPRADTDERSSRFKEWLPSREYSIVLAFIAVPLIYEAFWVFWPAIRTAYISLTDWSGGTSSNFVGLDNYRRMPNDPVFRQAFGNTIIWVAGYGTLIVVLGLALAMVLQSQRRGIAFYRAAIYLPMVFSLVVTGLFWRVLYYPNGPVNTTLGGIGLESWQRQWLADPTFALYAVMVAAIWRGVGYIMVLYLAGLKATDPQLNEAAQLDGCSPWKAFRYVIFPQLKPVHTVVLSVAMIDSLRTFDIVFTMTRGGPYNSSELLSSYMFQRTFTSLQYGYGSALAVVIFLMTVVFIGVYLRRAEPKDTAS